MTDDGQLALVFDDGLASDADEIRPLLDSADAPASFAIVSDWIGRDGHLTIDQLRTFADAGHEIVAHGRSHRVLCPHRLAIDAVAGDRRLAIEQHVFPNEGAGVVAGDEYELTNGDRTRAVEVVGTDSDEAGQYVELSEPLDDRWTADQTVFRLTEAGIRDEIVGGRDDLRERGFDPTAFVFPYDAGDVRAHRIARELFDVLPNAAVRSLPNPPGTTAWNLRRYYLETDQLTRVEIGEHLDAVAAEGGLGILAGHSVWDTVTPERVRFVVEAARERGIELTTVSGGVSPNGVV